MLKVWVELLIEVVARADLVGSVGRVQGPQRRWLALRRRLDRRRTQGEQILERRLLLLDRLRRVYLRLLRWFGFPELQVALNDLQARVSVLYPSLSAFPLGTGLKPRRVCLPELIDAIPKSLAHILPL